MFVIGVVALILIGAIFLLASLQKPSTPAPVSSGEEQAATSASLAGLQTYRSETLGLSFDYNASNTEVTEQGSHILVHPLDTPAGQGQSVEKFSKLAGETLAESIARQILAGYSTTTCKVEVKPASKYPSGYLSAQITYPPPADPEAPFWGREALCNEKYDQTNGVRFFLYDSDHPDRFYFFDIGQYPIIATGTITWQDSALIE